MTSTAPASLLRGVQASSLALVIAALGCGSSQDSQPSTPTESSVPTTSTPPISDSSPDDAASSSGEPTTTLLPVVETTTLAPPPSNQPARCSAPTNLADQAAALVMVGAPSADPAETISLMQRYPTLGGVFIGGNSTALFRSEEFQNTASAGSWFVAVDDEGGDVQRIDALVGSIPSASEQATLRADDFVALVSTRGRQLRDLGVTMNFAPVIDIRNPGSESVIGDRAFSADPTVVSAYADIFSAGMWQHGVMPTLKHFPGHGRAVGDSHESAVVTPTLSELQTVDLVPYRDLLSRRPTAVMIGHMEVPGLSGELPASLSPAVYELLRSEFGFAGLAVTDDLSDMRAIRDMYSAPEAAERAIAAGADLALLVSDDPAPIIARLEDAVTSGRISGDRLVEAVARVLSAKEKVGLC